MAEMTQPKWHIDPVALDAYYEMSSIQPAPEEGAWRVNPTFGQAEGFREIFELQDGFQLVTGDLTCHQEATLKLRSDGSLKFHCRLEGFSGLELFDHEQNQITRYSMGVLLSPPGTEKVEHYLRGEHERSVTLICDPHFLRQRFGLKLEGLPIEIKDYIDKGKTDHFNHRIPMGTDSITAARAILDTSLTGSLRRQYIESRALELLVLSLHSLAEQARNSADPFFGFSDRELERIQKARQSLEEHYACPPTITTLAREIGLNEAKLMHDFKRLYGQTIFDFTQNLRMDEAKRLLETTNKRITEIAFDVGYEYSSNFTTAFKRRFGIPPSVAREAFKRTSRP